MKDLLDNSRKEIEKIVFEREDINKLVEDKHKKEKKETFKMFFTSCVFCLLSTIGVHESIIKVTNYTDNISMIFLSIVSMFFLSLSSLCFLISFIGIVIYLIEKEENVKLEKQIAVSEIKVEKLMETNLNLEELNKLNPLMMKMKENLSEKDLLDIMRLVEIQTNRQLGNAYYFLYLIDNYDDLVSKVKEKQKHDDDLQKQMSCFFNIKKEI